MNTLETLVITIDQGVEQPIIDNLKVGRSVHEVHRDKLLALKEGDSFFLEGKVRDDITGLLRYASRMGVNLSARTMDDDPIYCAPGVRVWRVLPQSTKAILGDLKGKKGSNPWKDTDTQWVYHPGSDSYTAMTVDEYAQASDSEDVELIGNDAAKVRHETKTGVLCMASLARVAVHGSELPIIAEDEVVMGENPESIKYYLYIKTGMTYRTSSVAPSPNVNVVEITKEMFDSPPDYTKGVYSDEHGNSWWRNIADGKVVQRVKDMKLEGGPWVIINHDQYHIAFGDKTHVLEGLSGQTWWRKKNGVCVEVPAEKLEVARNTAGAIRLSLRQYEEWLKSQEQDDEL
jgi:hypothetical protein